MPNKCENRGFPLSENWLNRKKNKTANPIHVILPGSSVNGLSLYSKIFTYLKICLVND
jgi:hypothetical protein